MRLTCRARTVASEDGKLFKDCDTFTSISVPDAKKPDLREALNSIRGYLVDPCSHSYGLDIPRCCGDYYPKSIEIIITLSEED